MAAAGIAIIGAGMGGLVSAALLAARGCDVTVIEAAQTPGGKLRALEVDGSPIDAGPTVFTMRSVFDEIFEAAGARLDDHLTLRPAHRLARHAWEGGETLDLFADPAESEAAIADFAGAEAARGYRSFRAEAKRIHDILDGPFLRGPKSGPIALCRRIGLLRMGDLLAIRPYESLWKVLGEHFRDPRLRQLFARYTTYCGSSPFRTPATLMLITHVEASGVWLVEGGMCRLAVALETIAKRAGAKFRYGASVREIRMKHGRPSGIDLHGGDHVPADRVIVNADPAALAAGLFGNAARRGARPMPRAARSNSAMVWLARGRTSGASLIRHNVFFSNDYRAEFDTIGAGGVPARPSVYLCAQDRDDTGAIADGGSERFQIIVNAPADGDRHIYTNEEIDICQARMFASMDRCGVSLEPDAVSVLTPNDFDRLCPSTGGALYGRASHGWAASFLRQGTRTRIPGLYCAGGSTHPGAGVPMAALSGRLAAAYLLSDLASTARSRRGAIAGGISTRSATTAAMG